MIKCDICPHNCAIAEGRRGICKTKGNVGKELYDYSYGVITSLALDPVEKKPLSRFYPGSMILSVGSFGCNMKCSFCQNWRISTSDGKEFSSLVMPEELVDSALKTREQGNIGLAYTYNEPLINYNYVMDCSKLARSKGLKNVTVTNGLINSDPFNDLIEYIDAANIDLKGFTQDFYKSCGGDLDIVMNNIKSAAKKIHLEVTTLVIEGLNDDEAIFEEQCKWLSSVGKDIPFHISRFFPQYKMQDRMPTSRDKIFKLVDIAKKHLSYVFAGNI